MTYDPTQEPVRVAKRPVTDQSVTAEAMHYYPSRWWDTVRPWLQARGAAYRYVDKLVNASSAQLSIVTANGEEVVEPGDWIIRDADGEFSVCKPIMFAKTYRLT